MPQPVKIRRMNRSCQRFVVFAFIVLGITPMPGRRVAATDAPLGEAQRPRFTLSGRERAAEALNALHRLHAPAACSPVALWDGWLPHATAWLGPEARARYRAVLLGRRLDAEGCVAMDQHRGLAHGDGWPFPTWQQAGGAGWHFSIDRDPWGVVAVGLRPRRSWRDWEFEACEPLEIDPTRGLVVRLDGQRALITTPPFSCDTLVAPFVRVEWENPDGPPPELSLNWQLEGETDWSPQRVIQVPLPETTASPGPVVANVRLHDLPGYDGRLARVRLVVHGAAGSRLVLHSLFTAVDSRHSTTNALFVKGACEFFLWTRDLDFLRAIIARVRRATRYTLREFRVVEQRHVVVPWVGHDGRSGHVVEADGSRSIRPGIGIGSNYWDLLPFGGHDALATIELVEALGRVAEVERAIVAHPEWLVPSEEPPLASDDVESLVAAIREDFRERFWNTDTGRFVGWIDLEGRAYDYGFTFVNLQAIVAGLASPTQAESILDWLDGRRIVDGDTSQGADIYRWRFGPRSTTRRNVETYLWSWESPQSVPWGDQVQDGGAVLGFSYYDLLARLQVRGPDDAWRRLEAILDWFAEVQAEGGYRAWYRQPGRGTLQAAGTPGGLGLDAEFLESVLVPQAVLDGFLGMRPTADGFTARPRLPQAITALSVVGIHLHDQVVDLAADGDGGITVAHP